MLTRCVVFSGYPSFHGERLQGEQLWDIFQGLSENELVSYSHVLTGAVVLCSSLLVLLWARLAH